MISVIPFKMSFWGRHDRRICQPRSRFFAVAQNDSIFILLGCRRKPACGILSMPLSLGLCSMILSLYPLLGN